MNSDPGGLERHLYVSLSVTATAQPKDLILYRLSNSIQV